jgi:hypothetical protein
MHGTPHRDIELMPQIQVLDFKPAPHLNRLQMRAMNRQIRANIETENAPIPSHIPKPCGQHFREGQGTHRKARPGYTVDHRPVAQKRAGRSCYR